MLRQFAFHFVFSPFSLAARPSIDSLPAAPPVAPHPPWTPGSGALGLGGASAIEGRAKVPRTAGVAVLLCLAARCATDRRRHVPRGSIIGEWTNRYHGQCTRHKLRSATRLVEQEKQDHGMWWPCIRRHSRTLLEGDGVSDLSRSSPESPQHVVQAPFPTRFFTRAEAHPRPLSSPSAAHEQTGHDAAPRTEYRVPYCATPSGLKRRTPTASSARTRLPLIGARPPFSTSCRI